MKILNKLLKVIPLVFSIFLGNFYYEIEAKSRSSSSSSRSYSSSSRSSSSSSRSSSSSSRSSSSSSKSYSSSSKSSSSSSKSSSSSSKSSSSPSKSSSSSSKSSSSSSKSSNSSSRSSSFSSNKSSSSSNKSNSSRSNLDVNNNKNYAPKESKSLKTQTINGKKIDTKNLEDVFKTKDINTSTTRKYYYPNTYRRSILDNPFIRYYLVYNAIDDTIDMVTDTDGYNEDEIIGVVSNENGEDEILMFEEENKSNKSFFNITNIIIIILIIAILWIFLYYKKIFSKK
ncbi:hypothetical protein [[Clostridium] colinum]|uniref:hypothetical protein n=1 Tax=[Clostridium] colinum TaxID=36835 RepID=UPI002024E4C4|nr:hypothetical protein [[Clostridium] colinum]